MARDGTTPRVLGIFYMTVAQFILFFGLEKKVVTNIMLQFIEVFHRRVAHWVSGKTPQYRHMKYEWIYPPINKVLEEVGLLETNMYIGKRQNIVSDYVATWPIFELC